MTGFADANYSEGSDNFGAAGAGYEEPAADPVATEDPSGEQPATDSPEGAEATPEWDGSSWALKFRGSERVPESRDQLINWAQKGLLYDNKSAELASRVKEMDTMKTELGDLMAVKEAWDSNPEFRNRIQGLMTDMSTVQDEAAAEKAQDGQVSPETNSEILALKQEIQGLKQELGQVSNYQSDAMNQKYDEELKQGLDSVKEQYGTFDWESINEDGVTLQQELLQFMDKEGIYDPMKAFREFQFDAIMSNAKAEERKKLSEEAVKQKEQGIVTDEQSIPPTQPKQFNPVNGKRGYADISDHVVKSGRVSGE